MGFGGAAPGTGRAMSDGASRPLRVLQRCARRRAAEQALGRATAPLRNFGFPYRAPTVPRGITVPEQPPSLGGDYDTEWARSPVARTARRLIVAGPQRLLIDWVTDPEIRGHDRLADLARRAEATPTRRR